LAENHEHGQNAGQQLNGGGLDPWAQPAGQERHHVFDEGLPRRSR
jgi:hypothetical protein